jgi:Fe-S-cluster containining protein
MDSSTSPGMSETTLEQIDAELIAKARYFIQNDDSFGLDEAKTYLCTQCHECCKWITIQTYLKDIHPQMEFVKFYVEARKLTMMKTPRGVHLSIPHTCPHLIPGIGCDIYETRPASCRQYDGRIDFLLKDICKWKLLPEIMKEDEDEIQQGDTEVKEADLSSK